MIVSPEREEVPDSRYPLYCCFKYKESELTAECGTYHGELVSKFVGALGERRRHALFQQDF
jgi:hypothetical protein